MMFIYFLVVVDLGLGIVKKFLLQLRRLVSQVRETLSQGILIRKSEQCDDAGTI